MKVQVDWYTRACLTAIAVLLTVLVIGLWAEVVPLNSRAWSDEYADTKAKDAVNEGRWGSASATGKQAAVQTETNQRLDDLISLFKSGQAKVQVISDERPGGDHAGSRK